MDSPFDLTLQWKYCVNIIQYIARISENFHSMHILSRYGNSVMSGPDCGQAIWQVGDGGKSHQAKAVLSLGAGGRLEAN